MRKLLHITNAMPSSDGDGVQIHRVAGRHLNHVLDPYLLIDEINSEDSTEYIGGFPEHPHRGFETITFMKAGRIRHRDHMGNEGVIEAGDVQWMKAASGVVHSEMPEQEDGLLHGFQIWLNLPADEKMQAPDYRDIPKKEIPELTFDEGGTARVIAGRLSIGNTTAIGPMPARTTKPVIADITLNAMQTVDLKFDPSLHLAALIYGGSTDELQHRQVGFYGPGDVLTLAAKDQGARVLILAGKQLREPVVQYGPFVMNTKEEIETALQDLRTGQLVHAGQ